MLPGLVSLIGGRKVGAATFVGAIFPASSTPISFASIGAQAGDLAVRQASSNPSGWTQIFYDGSASRTTSTKQLLSGDLSASFTGYDNGTGEVRIGVYRGAKSAAVVRRSYYAYTDPSRTVVSAGFAKHVDHCGLAAFTWARDLDGQARMTGPASWAQRASLRDPEANRPRHYLFDRLSPPNQEYADDAPLVCEFGDINSGLIYVLELRSQ